MSAPSAAKTTITSLGLRQTLDHEGFEQRHWSQNKLSDAFAMEDFEWFRAEIDKEHLEFPTVI